MKTIFILFIISIVILMGCEGPQGQIGPTGSNGPKLKGELVGFVTLIDENGNALRNNSGVRIDLHGMGFDTTLTDSTGRWSFSNIETGIYSISTKKENCFSENIESIQFVGGGSLFLDRLPIYPLPKYHVNTYGVSSNSLNSTITAAGTVTSESMNQSRSVIICFDTTIQVGPTDGSYLFYEFASLPYNSNNFSLTIVVDSAFKSRTGIQKGMTLYMSAFAGAQYAPLSKYDKAKGKIVPAHYAYPPGGTTYSIPFVIVP
jgi:hypothetical protein